MIVDALPVRATIDLRPEERSVPAARRIVRELLAGWSAEEFCDDTLLLLSELVSNVVRHVPVTGPVEVELSLDGAVLRVAVSDGSPAPPVVRTAGAGGGHGLRLVSALSDRWGSDPRVGGKRVWFELRQGG